jgi:hypothetical protein
MIQKKNKMQKKKIIFKSTAVFTAVFKQKKNEYGINIYSIVYIILHTLLRHLISYMLLLQRKQLN